jgi:putative protein kinase ArgK-like GTPase of G3E family
LHPDQLRRRASSPATHRHDHHHSPHVAAGPSGARVPRIGVGGPVGSGKTALVAALCRALSAELTLGVVAPAHAVHLARARPGDD